MASSSSSSTVSANKQLVSIKDVEKHLKNWSIPRTTSSTIYNKDIQVPPSVFSQTLTDDGSVDESVPVFDDYGDENEVNVFYDNLNVVENIYKPYKVIDSTESTGYKFVTSLHPPSGTILVAERAKAFPFKTEVGPELSKKLEISSINQVVVQNNWTNLMLQSLSRQTTRMEQMMVASASPQLKASQPHTVQKEQEKLKAKDEGTSSTVKPVPFKPPPDITGKLKLGKSAELLDESI